MDIEHDNDDQPTDSPIHARLVVKVRLLDYPIHLFSISRLSSPTVSGNRRYFDLEMLQRYQASTQVFQHSLADCQPTHRQQFCLKPLLYCPTISPSVLFSISVHFRGVLLVCTDIPKN